MREGQPNVLSHKQKEAQWLRRSIQEHRQWRCSH